MQTRSNQGLKELSADRPAALAELESDVTEGISRIITSDLDTGQAYERLISEVNRLVYFDLVSINIADERNASLRMVYLSRNTGLVCNSEESLPLDNPYAVYVARTRRALIIQDLAEDSLVWNTGQLLGNELGSGIVFPLNSKGKVLATFGLFSRELNAYGEGERAVLERLEAHMAAVIENARLYEEAKAKAKEIEVMGEVGRILASDLGVRSMYERVTAEVRKLVYFDTASISAIDERNGTSRIAYDSRQAGSDFGQEEPTPLDSVYSGFVLKTRRTMVLEDLAENPQFWNAHRLLKDGLRSGILAPLISGGKVIATFGLYSRQLKAYGPREQDILGRIASQLAPAVQASRSLHMVRQLDLALESIGDVVMIMDEEGNIQFMNRAARAIFSDTSHAAPDGSCTSVSLNGTQGQELSRQIFKRALEGSWEGEVKSTRENGEEFDVHLTALPLKDCEDEVVGFVSVGQDITEHRRAQETEASLTMKSRELAELQKADQLRQDLVATVSHELRTPLASIKGYTSALLQPDVKWEPELQREFLEVIDQEADHLNRLVGDLLTMSQLEAGVLSLDLERNNVVDILNQVRPHLGPMVSRHSLHVDVPEELPTVLADEHRVAQVISNLVSNAAKFSEEGTKITIGASQLAKDVVLSVTDEGSGISGDRLERVFEPFYRVPGSHTTTGFGFGLGLSICRRLVEAQGGKIWAESEPGMGSTFFFSLPIAE